MRQALTTLAASTLLMTLGGYAAAWHPVLETVENFRLHLAALAAALFVLLALAGRRWGAMLALVAAIAAAAGLGPVYQPGKHPGAGRPLTLLYANLRHENPQPEALVQALVRTQAEILITSETTRAIAASLIATYPHHVLSGKDGPALRTAIWSKYPLTDTVLFLDNTVAPTAAAATVNLGDGANFGLIGAHFSRPFERLTRIQVDALGPIAENLATPLVVAADFNAAPWSHAVTRAAEVTGTHVLGGFRVTWQGAYQTPLGPVPEPWGHQIDQILLSESIGVDQVQTLPLPGSDHLGLLVRLRIPPR